MKYIEVRKTIAILAIVILAFVVVYCLATGADIPEKVQSILTAFVGFLGYYFGKSTALEQQNKNTEGTVEGTEV